MIGLNEERSYHTLYICQDRHMSGLIFGPQNRFRLPKALNPWKEKASIHKKILDISFPQEPKK
jgi:hypothetical protein